MAIRQIRIAPFVCMLLACCPAALALNPELDISQYDHKSWTTHDGVFKGAIHTIAQTPDGYLWLGTDFGLVRFDGVKANPWQPPAPQHLPSTVIRRLLVTRDGTLWIVTNAGLASWKSGKFSQYAEFADKPVTTLFEDHDGVLWAGKTSESHGDLCAIRNTSVQCSGPDSRFGPALSSIYEHGGSLWIGTGNAILRWKPGPPHVYPVVVPESVAQIYGLVEGDNGALWFTDGHKMGQIVDGKIGAPPFVGAENISAYQLLRDRQGSLWIGTRDRGLVHVHQGKLDEFSQVSGLSGTQIFAIFEDREGSIWSATPYGLDRFRDVAVPTFSANQGFPAGIYAVLADKDSNVWLDTIGLGRWRRGEITLYREQPQRTPINMPGAARQTSVARSGFPNRGAQSLFQDSRGRVWATPVSGAGYMENGRFFSSGVPGGVVNAIAEDTAGNLWFANLGLGLIRLSPRGETQQIPWTSVGKGGATALAGDPRTGGLWIGFSGGGLAYLADGKLRASYGADAGLGAGAINNLWVGQDSTVWAATDGGLSRLKDGRVTTLSSKNGLPCDLVHWSIEDDNHALWLYLGCGLVRITNEELNAWVSAPGRTISATVFDGSDGVRSLAAFTRYNPSVTKSKDGKLWFPQSDSVSVIDPNNLPFNKLPPPVYIEQIVVDRKPYGVVQALSLPALTRDLEIDYTALSFVAPEKVRFRYKLEGRDAGWQDAGNRRQAFYGDLPPRNYRFRVAAANNNGVWNEAGASLDFSVAPAYYQTSWFYASCSIAIFGLLWGVYRYRLGQLARDFNVSIEARVGERSRIARELHDTLLQSFQGLMLRLQVVDDLLPAGRAREQLEASLELADQAIAEGRNAVHDLRLSTLLKNDLAEAVGSMGNDLSKEGATAFRLVVEGTAQDFHPIVRDEIYRIAHEALRNAFGHSRARRIDAEITYGERSFRLRIRDDGKGIEPSVLEAGRPGHYGLPGMRERAKQIGGKLDISTGAETGTEIELTLADSIAYRRSKGRSFFHPFRK